MELFNEFPQLETENLILRQIQLTDAEAMFKIFSDPSVTQYHDLDTATRIEQVQLLINRRAEFFKNGRRIRWGIARRTDNMIIGSCGYSHFGQASFRAELGYELAQAHWRKGVMTEALKVIVGFGFEEMRLNRIEAMVMLENIASIRLLEKLGFQEEGILREYGYWKGKFHDLKLFSRLKKDWLRNC
jgi:ribosomal-protein-alanine N-acetyltransferase